MPAVAISAAIGGAATIYGANRAASATNDAARSASRSQRAALAQSERLSAPYREFGEGLIPQLRDLLTPGKDMGELLRSMPGYQFRQEEGNNATINAATATGMNLSGNTLRGLSEFNQGLADQSYQSTVDNLFRGVGSGQAAAAGQAQNAMQTGTNLSNIATNAGSDRANISLGAAGSIANIAGNTLQSIETQRILDGLNSGGMVVPGGTPGINPGAGGP